MERETEKKKLKNKTEKGQGDTLDRRIHTCIHTYIHIYIDEVEREVDKMRINKR